LGWFVKVAEAIIFFNSVIKVAKITIIVDNCS
jgi:hypothetical protein